MDPNVWAALLLAAGLAVLLTGAKYFVDGIAALAEVDKGRPRTRRWPEQDWTEALPRRIALHRPTDYFALKCPHVK